jgi:hypothetical protein
VRHVSSASGGFRAMQELVGLTSDHPESASLTLAETHSLRSSDKIQFEYLWISLRAQFTCFVSLRFRTDPMEASAISLAS